MRRSLREKIESDKPPKMSLFFVQKLIKTDDFTVFFDSMCFILHCFFRLNCLMQWSYEVFFIRKTYTPQSWTC